MHGNGMIRNPCGCSCGPAIAIASQLRKHAVPGMVTTLERKQRIYQICSEHDIVIVEDDPYYYLQYSLGSGTCLHINVHPYDATGLHVKIHGPKAYLSAGVFKIQQSMFSAG